MIQITIKTDDFRGKWKGSRQKTFFVEVPEISEYLKFIRSQGWTEAPELTVELVPETTTPATGGEPIP